MQKEFHSREIRAAAGRLARLSSQFQEIRTQDLLRVKKDAETLSSETANAIRDKTRMLEKNILSISDSISACAKALYEFARKVESADAEAKAMIVSK